MLGNNIIFINYAVIVRVFTSFPKLAELSIGVLG